MLFQASARGAVF